MTAADVFEPATPIKIRERRRPNWSAAMIVALAAVAGFVIYHEVSGHSAPSRNSSASASLHSHTTHRPTTTPTAHPKPTATPAAQPYANEVVISLKANKACWVQLTTANGAQVYQGVVAAGITMNWTEKQAVTLRLGNPGGVTLTVNGQTKPPGSTTQPVTLSFGPGPSNAS
jgi:hypothetical protein